jgi:hypothetical protein
MRNARSAKVLMALGATLIAAASPAVAASFSQSNGIDSGDVYGIDSGDSLRIDSGDAQGIDSGDAQGIDSGDAQGIDSGDAQGIDSGDAQGIDSGDAQGIDSGDAQGIDSGDAQGIDSGDAQGIDSGDAQGIDSGDAQGIDSGDAQGIDSGDVLAGPVSAIDRANRVFHSLGQVVMASDEMLNGLRVGDFVTVEGSIVSEGWLYADALAVAGIDYVAGATEVFVAGMLSEVDEASGQAQLGGLTIDYTSSLAVGSAPSNATWSFRGTLPALDGPMVSGVTSDFADH